MVVGGGGGGCGESVEGGVLGECGGGGGDGSSVFVLCFVLDFIRILLEVRVVCPFCPRRPLRCINIRDGEPRTATSTFSQLLSSECLSSSSVLLYVHRDRKDY